MVLFDVTHEKHSIHSLCYLGEITEILKTFHLLQVIHQNFRIDSIYIFMKDKSWMIFLWLMKKIQSSYFALWKANKYTETILTLKGQCSFSLNDDFSKNPHCHGLYCSSVRSILR